MGRWTYAGVIVFVGGIADGEFGNHFCVVGDFGCGTDSGGSDVTDAAALEWVG